MISRLTYSDRIQVMDGRVVRTVNASWPRSRRREAGNADIYRIDDEGKELCQHLYWSYYGGYMVGEENQIEQWDEPFINLNAFRYYYSESLTERDVERITAIYPEFRYTLQKAGQLTKAGAMRLLTDWKRNPKVELLVGAHLNNLVHNRTFARMTKEKQKAVLGFIRATEGAERWTLAKVLYVMQKKGSASQYDEWQAFRDRNGKVVEHAFWKKYGADSRTYDFYKDYLSMAKEVGHDIKDPYWRWPKDVKKAHDKVMAEHELMLEAKRIAEKKRLSRMERNKKRNFMKIVNEIAKDVVRKSGLKAYVPTDYKEIQAQAKALHQCLVSRNYYGKMANKECLLVFIADHDGKPLATAEIMPNGKIGQFYGDESVHDYELMKPSRKAQETLEKWLERYGQKAKELMKEAA